MDLVIMAAGMGSRFGGLKQLQPIDDDGNFIIDYTIFDAIKVGFDHVVFIVKRENFQDFKNTVGSRIERYVDVDYVFQDTSNIPAEYVVPKDRVKPFGTGHAVLCASPYIRGDFAVVNADDFYGRGVLQVVYDFLYSSQDINEYAIAGDKIINNFGEDGSVKRGVCFSENGYLKKIDESIVEKRDGKLWVRSLCDTDAEEYIADENQLVSMGLLAFKHEFLPYLQKFFDEFLKENKDDLSACEFFLPSVVSALIDANVVKTKMLSSEVSNWFGMTYKGDLEVAKEKIICMKKAGEYPVNLWNK